MNTARNLAILLCVQLAFALISWWPQDHSADKPQLLKALSWILHCWIFITRMMILVILF